MLFNASPPKETTLNYLSKTAQIDLKIIQPNIEHLLGHLFIPEANGQFRRYLEAKGRLEVGVWGQSPPLEGILYIF